MRAPKTPQGACSLTHMLLRRANAAQILPPVQRILSGLLLSGLACATAAGRGPCPLVSPAARTTAAPPPAATAAAAPSATAPSAAPTATGVWGPLNSDSPELRLAAPARGWMANEEVRLLHFDCTTTSEDHSPAGLRAQASGGPNGAAWNWYDAALICQVVLASHCAGEAAAALYVGHRAPALVKKVALSPGGEPGTPGRTSVSFKLEAQYWNAQVDSSPSFGDTWPYATIDLFVRVNADCHATDDHGPYPAGDLTDSFVGRFPAENNP